ncbi:MAG: hypothetical protein AABX63_05030, partial [Nanoarchaeota archaeon]
LKAKKLAYKFAFGKNITILCLSGLGCFLCCILYQPCSKFINKGTLCNIKGLFINSPFLRRGNLCHQG